MTKFCTRVKRGNLTIVWMVPIGKSKAPVVAVYNNINCCFLLLFVQQCTLGWGRRTHCSLVHSTLHPTYPPTYPLPSPSFSLPLDFPFPPPLSPSLVLPLQLPLSSSLPLSVPFDLSSSRSDLAGLYSVLCNCWM